MHQDSLECIFVNLLVISRYPFIQRFAKQNGITDVSTVIEAYETDKPIRYYLFLEKTEMVDPLRKMKPIDLYKIKQFFIEFV